MKKETADLLTSYSDELELHEEYSGRGMFGKTTTAVSGSLEDVLNSVAGIIENWELEDVDSKERDLLVEFLRKYLQDSLGRGLIFY